MNLVNIILWFVLFLFVVGFFVVVWKTARDWRWYNLVAVCITLLLAVVFVFPTAGVLKSRAAWHEIREKLEIQAAEAHAEQRLLKYGPESGPNAGEGSVSFSQKLSKLGVEAGRRWRNLQLQNVTNNNGTPNLLLTVAPRNTGAVEGVPGADNAAPAAAAPTQPLIPQDVVVYGFAESRNEQQILVPTTYLGEFRVVTSTPTQVTLAPTATLEPVQNQTIDNGEAANWSLYELLPLDSHQVFVAAGSSQSDENFLGRVDEELVRRLFAAKGISDETLQGYLRDGSRALDDDPPLSRWTMIEFLKNTAIEVDSPEQRGALDGGFFDGNGRAVDGRLQRGEDGTVKFKRGEQILLKEEAAKLLIESNDAKLIDQYYLRPLNDYRFVLRRIRLRLIKLASQFTKLNDEEKILEEAISKTEGMLVVNQDIKLKLEQDLAQFQIERKAIDDYTTQLQSRLQKMREEMIRLHRENIVLEQELEAKHLAIERRLDGITQTP